jgi:hypothetical protein
MSQHGQHSLPTQADDLMKVLALAPQTVAQQIHNAHYRTGTLMVAATVAEALAHLDRRLVNLAVVDPEYLYGAHAHTADGGRVNEFIARIALTPLLLCSRFDPRAIGLAFTLVRGRHAALLLPEIDRLPSLIRDAVEDALRGALARRVLAELEASALTLPPRLHDALLQLFLQPEQFLDVPAVALAARMARRSFDRTLVGAGMPRGLALMSAARVVAAYQLMRTHAATLRQIASAFGDPSDERLRRDIRELTDCTPTQFGEELNLDGLVSAVVSTLRATIDPARRRRVRSEVATDRPVTLEQPGTVDRVANSKGA